MIISVPEWNELVALFHAEGRDAVEQRHSQNAESARAAKCLIEDSFSDLSQKLSASKTALQRIADMKVNASSRLLARLDVQPDVWAISPSVFAGDNTLKDFLDEYRATVKPRDENFDLLVETIKEWKGCIDTVVNASSREQGIRSVRIGMEELELEFDATQRDHKRRPVEPSMIDPLAFRASIRKRFLGFVTRTEELYTPDWNACIAISPLPRSWCVETDEVPDRGMNSADEGNILSETRGYHENALIAWALLAMNPKWDQFKEIQKGAAEHVGAKNPLRQVRNKLKEDFELPTKTVIQLRIALDVWVAWYCAQPSGGEKSAKEFLKYKGIPWPGLPQETSETSEISRV